ncbi:TonB-dependent receptor plug domain-containing protein, partial [Novosphingobium album (ex Hu et al. 2023)]
MKDACAGKVSTVDIFYSQGEFGMKRVSLIAGASVFALLGAVMAPGAAFAAEGDGVVGGDIIVTARKVGERLQDIPLSINAFTEEALAQRDISDMEDLGRASPGFIFQQGVDRSFGTITFRGMKNNSVGDPTRENSSIFIDGIYYISVPAAMDFQDVERIEVVKGPQSAFFGRATFGGAMNFVTKTPSDDFGADFFLRAATYDEYEARASIQGGIVPGLLAVRASGKYAWTAGMYDNSVTGGKLGQQETKSVAGTVLFTPAPGLSFRGRASFVKQDDGAPASQLIYRLPTHNCSFGGTVPRQRQWHRFEVVI